MRCPRILVAAALLAALAAPARAQTVGADGVIASTPNYWFAGTRLWFAHPQMRGGRLAVASDDPGFGRFLAKLDATVSYEPGQSYVVLTTGDRRTITFTIGDARYQVSGATQSATFAPYAVGAAVYLPFDEIVRALYVLPVADGDVTVLQPQLATFEAKTTGRVTVVTIRGASPLHFKRASGDGDERLTLAFTGISSTLERERRIASNALGEASISPSGTPRNPTTVVTFAGSANSTHVLVPSDSPNAIEIAFAPAGVTLAGTPVPAAGDATVATSPLAVRDPADASRAPQTAAAAPSTTDVDPGPTPQTGATPTAAGLQTATVTGVDVNPAGDGLTVAVAVAGPVTYEWHRLPDNRWYVDLKPATLAMDTQDVPVRSPAVVSLRVKGFTGPLDRLPTVRIALSLASPRIVNVAATGGGLAIAVDRLDDLAPVRTGSGEVAGGKLVASIVPLPPVAAAPPSDADADSSGAAAAAPPGWKFAPAPPAGTNPRLIVLDPGHGGSDTGAMHNGLVEKDLTLDISRRLRTLLVARGWIVKMTRDSDVDVYQPNDSGRDELQARDDIANNAAARLFISIHCNAFTTSELSGTTTYFFKPDSYAFAQAIHARLAALPTRDDGTRKENFYVIRHLNAPAVLIETAFLSNPGDAKLMKTEAFRDRLASSIAAGVGDYASPAQKPNASSDGDGN